MNIGLLTKFFSNTSKNWQDTPRFATPGSERRQETRYISSGTQSIINLRLLATPVGEVERLSSALGGLWDWENASKKSRTWKEREHW